MNLAYVEINVTDQFFWGAYETDLSYYFPSLIIIHHDNNQRWADFGILHIGCCCGCLFAIIDIAEESGRIDVL